MRTERSETRQGPSWRSNRQKYLFVRVQEACNADCFFCEFALSKDTYRLPLGDMRQVARDASDLGVGVIRFTGGEPLMHPEIINLVRTCSEFGHEVSIITNGHALDRYAAELVDAGLTQVIVSLDSPDPAVHDTYRRTPRLFEKAVKGLAALDSRVVKRVNTVVGPHNYADMPQMQRVLEDLGVDQWELSPIKLSKKVRYPDASEVVRICDPIYESGREGALIPLGEKFYGSTPSSRHAYFELGQVPRPDGPACNVTRDVMFLDPKNGRQFACSLLPHRDPRGIESGIAREGGNGPILLDTPSFRLHRDHYAAIGAQQCQGCSTTAAGYSNQIQNYTGLPLWAY